MNQANSIATPPAAKAAEFSDASAAVDYLQELYDATVRFLSDSFAEALAGDPPTKRYRGFYPEIRMTTTTYSQVDSRLAFGHVTAPGTYSATITRPDLFRNYLQQQLELLMRNHGVSVEIGLSDTPMPVHFAVSARPDLSIPSDGSLNFILRDIFDVPDLDTTNDHIVNGLDLTHPDGSEPLAPFTAQRVDYSLARLNHYTATDADHFQNHVLFTNYQFYVDEFEAFAREMLADPDNGYLSFVGPGNLEITSPDQELPEPAKLPQMPSYHLKRTNGAGITLVNIGVGPSNAKTATDHIAVLRPHAWIMVGHCAGLRSSQSLGDFVLAHAYLREDKVLDDDLPVWIPIPPLAEIQIALENAVADVSELEGYELKRIMRTGTVASLDNRNWELREQSGPVRRLSQSRAIALDMESATIAANGFRFRVPYGTLLCVSDKPLHGELKLPGAANKFYDKSVSEHLKAGLKTIEILKQEGSGGLHSRKLRSFDEPPFR